jgi:hypothetical protein
MWIRFKRLILSSRPEYRTLILQFPPQFSPSLSLQLQPNTQLLGSHPVPKIVEPIKLGPFMYTHYKSIHSIFDHIPLTQNLNSTAFIAKFSHAPRFTCI